MQFRQYFNERVTRAFFSAGLLTSLFSTTSHAESFFEFEASTYYCAKMNGTTTGDRRCKAEYKPYRGDACAIYRGADEQDDKLDQLIEDTSNQCSGSLLDAAKAKTLQKRGELMGSVSVGHDERINDPVWNPDMRPEGSTKWTAMSYFANECAIQTCGSSPGTKSDDGSDTDTNPNQSYRAPEENNAAPQCEYENDGQCDVPNICPSGTDINDCRPKQAQNKLQESSYTNIEVCNNHEHTIFVAFGARYAPDDKYFTFRGWRSVEPNSCRPLERVLKGYVYLHAEDKQGHSWGLYQDFCVKSGVFRYLRDGTGRCSERTAKFNEFYVRSNNYSIGYK